MSESENYDLSMELDGENAADFIFHLLSHLRDGDASIDRISLEIASEDDLDFDPVSVGAALSAGAQTESVSQDQSLADGGITSAQSPTSAAPPTPLEASDSAQYSTPDSKPDTKADSKSDTEDDTGTDTGFDSFSKTPREWAENLSLGISTSHIALVLAAAEDVPLRVSEIEERLERAGWDDFASSTLHTRLNELRSDGLLDREEASGKGNPHLYEPTEFGEAALQELVDIVRESDQYETYHEAVDELQPPDDGTDRGETPIEADIIESDERERSLKDGELIVTVDEAGYPVEEVWEAENEPYVLPKDANPGDLRKGVIYEAEIEDVKGYGFFVRVKRTTGKGDVSGLVHKSRLDRRRPSDFRPGMTAFVELENLKPNGDISFHFHGLAGEEEGRGLDALFTDREATGSIEMFPDQ